MKRSEMLIHIKEDLLEKLKSSKFHINSEHWAEYVANELLDMIEGFGMKPPCVDEDKCQFLMHKYIDPTFYYWDEDFDEEFKGEYEKK